MAEFLKHYGWIILVIGLLIIVLGAKKDGFK